MKKRIAHPLVIICALSILARTGAALYLGDVVAAPPQLTDQLSYHALAVRLLGGYGYSFDRGWYPFTPPNTPTAHWSFLYPLFLVAVYALFGVHPVAARLVQGVLGGLLLPWVAYRLSRAVVGVPQGEQTSTGPRLPSASREAVPLAAAALAALYGYFVLYAVALMTETFYIVSLLWSLELGLKAMARLRQEGDLPWSLALTLGCSLGLAALLRQSILPWVVVLFACLAWQAWRSRRLPDAVRTLCGVGLILVACIAPWTYRNYRVYGQFLLLNSNAGYAMYSAQHPLQGVRFQEFSAVPVPAELQSGNEAQMDRALMRAGIQFILDDPVRYLRLSLSRARAFFEFWPTADTSLLHNVGRTASFGLLLPFYVYGLYLALRDRRLAARSALLFAFAAFYTAMHLLTWAMVRYRLPIDGVLLPLPALALLDLARRTGLIGVAGMPSGVERAERG